MIKNSKTSFELWVEEEVPRMQVLAQTTDNPLFLWNAIRLLVNAKKLADGLDHELPQSVTFPKEIVDYLLRVACTLHAMQDNVYHRLVGSAVNPVSPSIDTVEAANYRNIDAKEAVKLIPDALGLTRDGWNAFANFDRAEGNIAKFWTYKQLRESGLSSGEAFERVRDLFEMTTERQARRHVEKGKDLSKRSEPKPTM